MRKQPMVQERISEAEQRLHSEHFMRSEQPMHAERPMHLEPPMHAEPLKASERLMHSEESTEHSSCKTYCGMLPANARLANPFVPFQNYNSQTYPAKKGVVRGTLFPGLDLPFMGMVNEHPLSDTHLHELQSLGFAIVELGQYLDTHEDDAEAFELFRCYADLYKKGKKEYEKLHGPLTQAAAAEGDHYRWMQDPWPWDYAANVREG